MNYSLEVKFLEERDWYEILDLFDDASIYQSYAYGAVRWGSGSIVHAVFKCDGEIIAAGQFLIRRLPGLSFMGVAFASWGPMVRRKGIPLKDEHLNAFFIALRHEFVEKRKLFLRVFPNAIEEKSNAYVQALNQAKFTKNHEVRKYKTFILDLSLSEDEIRKNFKSNWRGKLSKAERNNLEVRSGSSSEYFAIFAKLYEEMIARKNFATGVDYLEFMRMQEILPAEYKMMIWVCYMDNKPISAIVCSMGGDSGIYILGATDNAIIGANPSYLLHWNIIQYLKVRETKYYDLGGVDQSENPNIYSFKQGMAGKDSAEIDFIGMYECSPNRMYSAAFFIFDFLQKQKPRLMRFIHKIKNMNKKVQE